MMIEIVLVLPISSSVCERGFSAEKRIKSDWRSNLKTDTMNNLLMASIQGPPLEQYDAERVVHAWWIGGQRERRPQFARADTEDELLNSLMTHYDC